MRGEPSDYPLDVAEAFHDDVHRWEGYLFIDVGGYYKDVELVRVLKDQSIAGLVGLFDDWARGNTSFEQDLNAEYEAAGRGYMDAYMAFAASITAGNFDAFLTAPIISSVESMLHVLPDTVPPEQRLRTCAEFFMRSRHFRETPYAWLNAHLLTTLRADVKAGHHANRQRAVEKLSGFFTDVEHIATYAPYIDGIFLDKAMAELVSKRSVGLQARYGVRVFSINNWDTFIEWLCSIEASGMTLEHKAALQAAYPGQRSEFEK